MINVIPEIMLKFKFLPIHDYSSFFQAHHMTTRALKPVALLSQFFTFGECPSFREQWLI